MFESGARVAAALGDLTDEQVQPNGVDLTVDAVHTVASPGRIATGGKTIGDREPVEPEDGVYHLDPGGYVVSYGERVAVPEDHVGFVLPRSSLMRNGATVDTAVWDAGYEGRGEGLLEVHSPIEIEDGARVAQFVLARAEAAGTYDGTYQGEGLEDA